MSLSRKAQLNLIIGVFFSELGTRFLHIISTFDANIDRLRNECCIDAEWSAQDFNGLKKILENHEYTIDIKQNNLKEIHDFHNFWEETLKRYRGYFKDQIFCNYVQLNLFRHSFIVDKYESQDREIHEIICGGREVKIDDLDFQILEILAKDARISTVEIANKINSTVDTIKNRIKRLTKLDVVQGFRVSIDYNKLGFQFFKVNINLNDYNDRGRIIRYIRLDPHLVMIDKSIGYFDLELDFWVRDLKEFHQIMDNLTIAFPESIKNYIYVHNPQLHKMRYIPEE